ncbi:nucleotide exchange factor GrpE [Conexibacter stalactiti]|uniref:Protein GrpE n=1 Tax=Conexibacter stalactiti TaxID=1940611 RepID=A0ABU4HK98_9ACTN|nr:nucleotide exchange factor GrpE [Conexibacter stalactiti]MDW5593129.1 nucleotide exchange factor GrpE [Conexibacter stalactiti]MEC5033770.1 nucleotide exchange factor GrpE [Conexibacter stalactiti]
MPSSHESEQQGQGASPRGDDPAPQPPEPTPPGDEAVERLRGEVAQLDDRWRRALADLDNYRKRSAAEVERRSGEARERLLTDWLEVVDSVERALRMRPGDSTEDEGLRPVLQQIETLLQRHGLRRVGAVGEPFDPERHDAIGVRETDELPDRAIAEVARSGWALGDRVLRPAQVLVARHPAGVGQSGAE